MSYLRAQSDLVLPPPAVLKRVGYHALFRNAAVPYLTDRPSEDAASCCHKHTSRPAREMLQSVSFVSLFVYYVMPRVEKEEVTEFVPKKSGDDTLVNIQVSAVCECVCPILFKDFCTEDTRYIRIRIAPVYTTITNKKIDLYK